MTAEQIQEGYRLWLKNFHNYQDPLTFEDSFKIDDFVVYCINAVVDTNSLSSERETGG